jgi:hypothetical protein
MFDPRIEEVVQSTKSDLKFVYDTEEGWRIQVLYPEKELSIDDKIIYSKFIIRNTKAFEDYSIDFKKFSAENKIKLPKISTARGQVWCLFTSNKNLFCTREDLDNFLRRIEKVSKDSIQLINKTDQKGLVHKTIKHNKQYYYTVPWPFIYNSLHVTKRIFGKLDSRDEKIEYVKQYVKQNYLDAPNDQWQVGHRNPYKHNIAEEEDLVYQPPIQARYRDRYIFDKTGLIRIPTIDTLIKDDHLKDYPIEELQKLYDYLPVKFPKIKMKKRSQWV